MSILYKAFIKQRVRKATAEVDIPLERAIRFLEENPKFGIIEDLEGTAFTIEELKDVKSFGSDVRIGQDIEPATREEIFESSDTELFETTRDRTEPSTERNN